MALRPLQRKCALQIFITHKNPQPSAGPEPATAGPVGPTASMLTTKTTEGGNAIHIA
jgi:hypothetical protein